MKRSSFLLVCLFCGTVCFGQERSGFSVGMSPYYQFSLPSDAKFFPYTVGASLDAEFRLPSLRFLSVGARVGYGLADTNLSARMSLISIEAGGGPVFDIAKNLTGSLFLSGGYYYGFLNDLAGPQSGYPVIAARLGLDLMVSKSISLRAWGGYRNYLGLLGGIAAGIGTQIHIAAPSATIINQEAAPPKPLLDAATAEGLQIREARFDEIFPVFYSYYDEHPIGTATLVNSTTAEISGISVSLLIKQYMDSAKGCKAPALLHTGESAPLEFNALFTDRVLGITEGTKVAAEITVRYSVGEEERTERYVETVRLYDRNATRWDDDRKAAAFVTAKDPAVLAFAKNMAGIAKDQGSSVLNEALRTGMVFHAALRTYGLSYVVDPKTPYEEFSSNKQAVDFLQFPAQTLRYKAGDCDDLAILACALFEAVGIETAFITVPGHIFMAFSLGLSPEEAARMISKSEELIMRGGAAWVPLEVTALQGDFLNAWATGAREWREASARRAAGFLPVHEAWRQYEPVGLVDSQLGVIVPDADSVVGDYRASLEKLVDREVTPKAEELRNQMAARGASPALLNRLGVLYARYGLLDQAKAEFTRALSSTPSYLPSLINMGNLAELKSGPKEALEYFERAYRLAPENPSVLLSVARTHHKLENYGLVDEVYSKLKAVSPTLAEKYSYLQLRGGGSSRAAEAGSEVLLWVE